MQRKYWELQLHGWVSKVFILSGWKKAETNSACCMVPFIWNFKEGKATSSKEGQYLSDSSGWWERWGHFTKGAVWDILGDRSDLYTHGCCSDDTTICVCQNSSNCT